MGWEALGQWGDDVVRVERLAGGVANDVWSVRVDGRLAVGRLGTRSDADLAWETGLLQHLDREGLTVPVPIPTRDGRLFVDGLVVMAYLEGGPPETQDDWRRVAGALRELHRLTRGWPQRPGWRSSTDLLHAETGTRVDLGAMPHEAVARCRAAWARLVGRETCVVHGNPANPGNVRMTADQVGLIDWDESHVDVPVLDLVLPGNAAGLDDGVHDIAAQASAAWEAAVCWEDEYAVKRLAEVRSGCLMDFDLLRQLAADGYLPWKVPGPRDADIASLMAAVDSGPALEERAGQVDLGVARVLNGFAVRMAATAVRRRDVAWVNYGLAAAQLAATAEDGREVIPTYSVLHRAAELIGVDADALFRERSYLQPAPGWETPLQFALRRPQDKSIAVMGYTERNDRDGLVFRPAK